VSITLRTYVAAGAAVALLGSLSACGHDKNTASGTTSTSTTDSSADTAAHATITMKNLAFTPKDLTVAPGTMIMILNADDARHDLTDTKSIDSGDIEGGKSGMVKAPTAPGDYPFKCKYHFGMEGVLHVK
jgi:plastocyanin